MPQSLRRIHGQLLFQFAHRSQRGGNLFWITAASCHHEPLQRGAKFCIKSCHSLLSQTFEVFATPFACFQVPQQPVVIGDKSVQLGIPFLREMLTEAFEKRK
jgi:hypothetical protein